MPNYRESQVTGSRYTRTHFIGIRNPFGGVPSVTFKEEEAISLGEDTVTQDAGVINVTFDDPSKVINILDPVTGEPTGQTITWGEMYAIIYSAYLQEAAARDAAALEPEPEPEPEPTP